MLSLAPLLSCLFGLTPVLTFRCRKRVSSCHWLFLHWSPSLHTLQLLHTLSPTVEGSSRPQSDPQNSPGWAGCRPQQSPDESCARPYPSITQRGDRRGARSSVPPYSSWNPPRSVDVLQRERSDRFCRFFFTWTHSSWRATSDCVCSQVVAIQSWTMKLSLALFFAGLFGALAAVFILLSFGTDYWLLASETCPLSPDQVADLDNGYIEVSVTQQGIKEAQRIASDYLFCIRWKSCVYRLRNVAIYNFKTCWIICSFCKTRENI